MPTVAHGMGTRMCVIAGDDDHVGPCRYEDEITFRRFELHRDTDITGVSGAGVIVEGVRFSDGRCAYRWLTATATTTMADSIDDVMIIHGHDGATRLVWID